MSINEEMKDPLIEALNERAEQLVEENAALRDQVQTYRAEIEELRRDRAWIKPDWVYPDAY